MFNVVKTYFESKKYLYHFFQLFGFSKKDYSFYQIISTSKNKTKGTWFFNNLYFPLLVIISPFALTLIHRHFGTVNYNKSIVDILISGSLTLLGITVLRTSSTAITERLDDTNIPSQYESETKKLFTEIDIIRNRLDRRMWILTFVGWFLYIMQIGQFIINTGSYLDIEIGVVLILIILVTFISILYGRFIHLVKTNILDRDEVIRLLFGTLLDKGDELKSLEDKLKQQGL